MFMVVVIGIICAGLSIFVSDSVAQAASPLDSLSTFAKTTTTTKKKCDAKKGLKKKDGKCVKVTCKAKKGYMYTRKGISCAKKKPIQCDTKHNYKKSGKKCVKKKTSSSKSSSKGSSGSSSGSSGGSSSSTTPAPKAPAGDGDCTKLNFRDDQGFRCNNAEAQKICKDPKVGGHAILDKDGNPKCIKKNVTCNGGAGYLEQHADHSLDKECVLKDPKGRSAAPTDNNADCTNGGGKDANGYDCNLNVSQGELNDRKPGCDAKKPSAHLVRLPKSQKVMCVFDNNAKICQPGWFKDAILNPDGACVEDR